MAHLAKLGLSGSLQTHIIQILIDGGAHYFDEPSKVIV